MDVAGFRRLVEAAEDVLHRSAVLEELIFVDPQWPTQCLEEGKWIPTSSGGSIRIDPANYGAGQTHAHIYGRKGEKLGAVNLDGSSSHGTKMRIGRKDAEALRAQGFDIRKDRIVEWLVNPSLSRELLLG